LGGSCTRNGGQSVYGHYPGQGVERYSWEKTGGDDLKFSSSAGREGGRAEERNAAEKILESFLIRLEYRGNMATRHYMGT